MMRTTLSRKIKWGVLIAIMVLLLVLLEVMAGPSRRLNDLVISQSTWTEIMAERARTEKNLISTLNLDGQNLVYDESENRWFYSLVEGDSMAYDPTVRFKSDGQIELAILSEGLSEGMVKDNESRKMMAYTETEYQVYDLTATTLPLLSVNYDGDELLTAAEEKYGTMRLFDNRDDAKQRVVTSEATFHRRGGSSLLAEKPSLRMNLKVESLGRNERNNFLSLLGMRKDDDWVLYAAEDTINNVFSSNLWNETSADINNLGVHNGYEYKYIELIINGNYEGLYALGYKPDEKMMALNSDREGDYTEYMFRKIDWGNGYYDEEREWDKELNADGFELISDTKYENDAWRLLGKYFDTITDSTDETELRTISDLKTTTDYHLFVNLIQAIDQASGLYDKNYFLTFKKDASGNYVALYTPWDLDVTLGREFIAGNLDSTVNVEPENSPLGRMLKIGASVDLQSRYRELRMHEWSDEAMEKRFDKYEEEVFGSGAYDRNAKRWKIETADDYSFSKIKEYVLARLEYLDGYYGLIKPKEQM